MGSLTIEKRVGAYNDNGLCVIPWRYDEIKTLRSGIYVARIIKTGPFPPYKDIHRLYTEKGILKHKFVGDIAGVFCDKNEEVVALQINNGTNCEWRIVEVDYEKNTIEELYNNNSIKSLKLKNLGFIELINSNGETEIFSPKEKKIILKLKENEKLISINHKGFVIQLSGLLGFCDLEGRKILQHGWYDIYPFDNFLGVSMKVDTNVFKYGLYSYEGKEVLPCKYWSKSNSGGAIVPELICLSGIKTWFFKIHQEIGEAYYDELLTSEGKTVLSVKGDCAFISGSAISISKDRNVVVKENEWARMYKLECDGDFKVKARLLCEANKIEEIGDSGEYEIRRGRKKEICNSDGTIIKSLRHKTILERVKDYFNGKK